jgi:hypothetical protein
MRWRNNTWEKYKCSKYDATEHNKKKCWHVREVMNMNRLHNVQLISINQRCIYSTNSYQVKNILYICTLWVNIFCIKIFWDNLFWINRWTYWCSSCINCTTLSEWSNDTNELVSQRYYDDLYAFWENLNELFLLIFMFAGNS